MSRKASAKQFEFSTCGHGQDHLYDGECLVCSYEATAQTEQTLKNLRRELQKATEQKALLLHYLTTAIDDLLTLRGIITPSELLDRVKDTLIEAKQKEFEGRIAQ